MARTKAVYRVQMAQGSILREARQMSRAARAMRRILIQEMRGTAEAELELAFLDAAPYDQDERDSEHLIDNIEARTATSGRIVTSVYVTARSPRGFNYLDVTRYGHRKPIRPRQAPRLRWRDSEGWHSAKQTRGSHPVGDWVEQASRRGDRVAADVAEEIGRVVYTRLL